MIKLFLVLVLPLAFSLYVPEPRGERVAVTITAESGTIGETYPVELDNDNEDTPWCGVGRALRECRVIAGPISAIHGEWRPDAPRCGRLPTLIATAGEREIYRRTIPLPAGVSCMYLPLVVGP